MRDLQLCTALSQSALDDGIYREAVQKWSLFYNHMAAAQVPVFPYKFLREKALQSHGHFRFQSKEQKDHNVLSSKKKKDHNVQWASTLNSWGK